MTGLSEIKERTIQIGDLIPRAGIYTQPGVVSEIKENGDVVVNTDPAAIKQHHRYAITNGLSPEHKDKFNQIMDEVSKMKTNDERLNALQRSIDELRTDPQQRKVADALHNEQAVLIRMSRELPRVYQLSAREIQL